MSGEFKVLGNAIEPKNINASRITCRMITGDMESMTNSFTVAAGHTVNAGDVVSIGPDGDLVTGFGFPTSSEFSLSDISIQASCALTPTTIVNVFQNSSTGLGRARVGTVVGTGVVYSSASFLFSGVNLIANSISVQRLSNTTFVVAYRDATVNRGRLIIGEVTGSGASATIAFQVAPTDFNGALNAGNVTDSIRLITMAPNVFILVFRDTGNSNRGSWLLVTVVGTGLTATFTLNTKSQFNGTAATANNINSLSASSISATQFVVAFANATTSLNALVGTVTGAGAAATIAAGPSIIIDPFHVVSPIYISVAVLSPTVAVLAFQQNLNPVVSTDGLICVLTISGNTLTAGPSFIFMHSFSDGMQWPWIARTSPTTFAIAFRNLGQFLQLEMATGTVSGSTITMDQQNVQLAPNSFDIELINLTDTDLFVSYIETSFLSRGQTLLVSIDLATNTVITHEVVGRVSIGIAANSASAGGAVTVVSRGLVNIPNQVLRVGYLYFAHADGTLTLANDATFPMALPFAIGFAVGEHELFVTNLFLGRL